MCDQHEYEETRERIRVMLHQEERFYTCPEYMAPDYLQISMDKRAFIEEDTCLVTNLGLEASRQPYSGRKLPSRSTSFSRYSPNSVVTNDLVSSVCPKSVTPEMDHSHLCPWRRQMCDWAYTALDTFHLDREMVAVAFDLLDRYLAKEIKSELSFTREDFQLYCMVCLYIAVKMLEPSRKLSVEALTEMSRGYYSVEDVEQTEVEILHSLQWRVNVPTALAFVRAFLELVPDSDDMLPSCQQFVELAVSDSFFVPYKASSIAVAAITLVAHQNNLALEELANLQDYVALDSHEVLAIQCHVSSLE